MFRTIRNFSGTGAKTDQILFVTGLYFFFAEMKIRTGWKGSETWGGGTEIEEERVEKEDERFEREGERFEEELARGET
jgi:hypothetical protein